MRARFGGILKCDMSNMTLSNTMHLAVSTINFYRTEPD